MNNALMPLTRHFLKTFPGNFMLKKMKEAFENEDLMHVNRPCTIDNIGKVVETDTRKLLQYRLYLIDSNSV